MKIKRSAFSLQRSAILTAVFCLLTAAAFAQTNRSSEVTAANRAVDRPEIPADFQRLQYYYAAAAKSPTPGTERNIFTLRADRRWSGDWNSRAVPKPTRAQLDTITAEQVDLFRRAGAYADGQWRIVTSREQPPLSKLTLTPASYARLRLTIERDQAYQRYQQLDQELQATPEP